MVRRSSLAAALALLMNGVALSACGSSKPKTSPTFGRASATPSFAGSPTPAPECILTGSFQGDLAGALTTRVSAVVAGSELRVEGTVPSGLGSDLPIDVLLDIEPFRGAGTYPAVNTLGATPSPSAAASASAAPSASPSASPTTAAAAPIRSSVLSLVFDPAGTGGYDWSTAQANGGATSGSVVVAGDLQTISVVAPMWQSNLASHADTGKTASANLSVFCPAPLRPGATPQG